jgi:type I restriction enzyme M protein
VLINTMIEVLKPNIETTIHDPCSGTWWFLLSAHDYILHHGNLDKDQQKILKTKLISWSELVQSTARLAVMNMFLHGIGENESPITVCDSLLSDPWKRYKMVATNPPFGKKSSVAFTNEAWDEEKDDTEILREDFWTITKNKQLNFLQHIHTILEIWGKAWVVLPDNVLFEWWSGEVVRKKLLQQCNLHTILRLPTGIFYANGVKANVIFFDKKWASEQTHTKDIWFYDLRTNMKFSLKQSPLKVADLKEFIECYNSDNINKRTETRSESNPEWRRKKYTYDEVIKRDKTNLDIFWLKDKSLEDSENLPEPWIIAQQIVDDLENALEQFNLIEKDLGK